MLELTNIQFGYSNDLIFKNLNLSFKAGELTSIVGKSGVGKSTLLSLVNGELHPQSGELKLYNEYINKLSINKRPIATMFQFESLFDHMDVKNNISFPLTTKYNRKRFKNVNRAEIVSDLLNKVGLKGFEDKDIATLSGGQKQRVTLARSLAVKPKILLLDEPFSALDPELRSSLNQLVLKVIKEYSIIAINITHNLEDALLYSDSIVHMTQKKVKQFKPKDLNNEARDIDIFNFFNLGLITETYGILIKDLVANPANGTSHNCKIITCKNLGPIYMYVLEYNSLRFNFYNKDLFEQEIHLGAKEENKIHFN